MIRNNSISIKAFVDFLLVYNKKHVAPLYEDGATFKIYSDKIALYRPVPDSTYNILKKKKDGTWVPYYDDDKILIEFSDYFVLMLSVVNRNFRSNDDFTIPLTYVPDDIIDLYDEIYDDAFDNAMVHKDAKYTINIKDKKYKEISVMDYSACEDDPGEVTLTICDIIKIAKLGEDKKVVTYRESNTKTNTLTLKYKNN